MRQSIRPITLFLALLLTASPATLAVSVKVANLKDLIEQSDRIFVGKCLSAVSSMETGIPRTTYSFQVVEPVRGVKGNTVEVRQFGVVNQSASGEGLRRGTVIQGMPSYRVGGLYLLFLVAESPVGLSSPAGLFQGAFRAKGDGFLNPVGNRNLTRGLEDSWLRKNGLSEADIESLASFRGGVIESRYFLQIVRLLSR